MEVVVAERLRRQTRNLLGSPRAGSNPADYDIFFFFFLFFFFFFWPSFSILCIRFAGERI